MSEISENAPKPAPGYRYATRDDLMRPLPPGARYACPPFDAWIDSCREGEVIGETTHVYCLPITAITTITPMDPAYQPSETLDEITKLIPATFYADRPIEERVAFMVQGWQKAIKGLTELEARVDAALANPSKAQADLDYFKESLAAGKRPFSDVFSAQVIDGQVKTIQRLEKRCAELSHEISNLRDDLASGGTADLLGATIVSQRDRIKILETPANKYNEIEMLLARRPALDGFATAGEKVAALLHMCATADPSGELTKQHAEAERLRTQGLDSTLGQLAPEETT